MLCSVCSRNESTFITLEWRTSAPTDVAMPTSVVDTMRLLVIMMCVSEWTLEVRSTHSDWLPVCHPTCLSVNISSSHSLRSCVLGTFPFQPVLESSTIEIRPESNLWIPVISFMFIEYRFDTNRNNLSRFVSPHLQRRKAFLKLVRRSHLQLHLLPLSSQSRLYQRVCCCFLYRWPPRGGFLIGHIILIKL